MKAQKDIGFLNKKKQLLIMIILSPEIADLTRHTRLHQSTEIGRPRVVGIKPTCCQTALGHKKCGLGKKYPVSFINLRQPERYQHPHPEWKG
jgi:hypothetical protein